MDPALRELLAEPGDPEEEVAVLLRLSAHDAPPAKARIVAVFGDVATARVRRCDVEEVHDAEGIITVKAPREYGPEVEPFDSDADPRDLDEGPRSEAWRAAQARRPPGVTETGRGVVIGFVDWGCDFMHPDLRREDGGSRLLGLWDQRAAHEGAGAQPYGYGRVFDTAALDAALATADPVETLQYDVADVDPGGGAHGSHTLSIALGNGAAGGPPGVAPEARGAFVHLAARGRGPTVPLGSSIELLEALDFLDKLAGVLPLVVNLSLGRHAGDHSGRTCVERAMDAFVTRRHGRAIVQSCGNYYQRRTHGSWQLHSGDRRRFSVVVQSGDRTPNEIDIWYPGRDTLRVGVSAPDLGIARTVSLGEEAQLALPGGRVVGRIHHRADDPNNGDNECSIVLDPHPDETRWEVTLVADDVVDGRAHAWIERDGGCLPCQSHLPDRDADPRTTTGTIANGFRTIVVGAYDARDPAHPIAPFSSSGATRDGRQKPDLCAAGVDVLGVRSRPRSGRWSPYVTMSGTSMASPAVAGTVALLYQRAGALSIEELRRILLVSCADPGEGTDPARVGAGLLDIEAALALAGGPQAAAEAIAATESEESMESIEAMERRFAQSAGGPGATEAAEPCGCDPLPLFGAAPSESAPAYVSAAEAAPAAPRVAIIGGGLSGLAAADVLREEGVPVTVFEARDRLGGRVRSRGDVIPGKVVEAGAEFVGANHDRILELAKRFGVRLLEVDRTNRGLRQRTIVHGVDVQRIGAVHDLVVARSLPVLTRIGREAADVDPFQPWAARRAAEWDRTTVAERLRRPDMFGRSEVFKGMAPEVISALARSLLELRLSNDLCAPMTGQSYLGLLAAVSGHRIGADLLAYWNRTEEFRLAGGAEQLVSGLARGVDVRLSDPVTRIEVLPDGVRVHPRASASEFYAHVILAGPPGSWPVVQSTPAFLPGRFTMRTGPAVKYVSTSKRRHWEADGLAPAADSDEWGMIWETSDGQQRTQGYGLSVFAGGSHVRARGDYQQGLDALFPRIETERVSDLFVDWAHEPWILTGYSSSAPGQVVSVAPLLQRPFAGRLHFAGEQASPAFFGFMEGAVEAGMRSAEGVLAELNRAAVRPVVQLRESVTRRGPALSVSAPAVSAASVSAPALSAVDVDVLDVDRLDEPWVGGMRNRAWAGTVPLGPAGVAEAGPGTCTPAPEGPVGPSPHPVIRSGSRRPAVGYAQQQLNIFLSRLVDGTHRCAVDTPAMQSRVTSDLAALRAAGELPLKVDCVFGRNTDRAMRLLQSCQGLGVDGAAGKETWPVLDGFAVAPAPPPASAAGFALELDVKRSGTLTAASPGWSWGAAGSGAVVLVNNDADVVPPVADLSDRVIAGGDDVGDVARLRLSIAGPVPPGASVELSVSDPRSLRIFGGPAAGAVEIIGPTTSASHVFAAPTPTIELAMEGLRYAGRGFTGEVEITVRTRTPGAAVVEKKGSVRVAPWIVANHQDAAETVFVCITGDNARFRSELRTLVAAAGCTLRETPAGDRWMQDCLEFGHSTVPGRSLRTVVRAAVGRVPGGGLDTFPPSLLAPNLGFTEIVNNTGRDADSTGNLESSPPVTVGGKTFPFGRIYVGSAGSTGHKVHPLMADFFAAQQVQRPIILDMSWLAVGHVDEVISFVPAPTPKGFMLLLASTNRAYDILDAQRSTGRPAKMLTGRSWRTDDGTTVGRVPAEISVEDFLKLREDFHPQRAISGRPTSTTTLRANNRRRQTQIDATRTKLLTELGLDSSDIIEVPSLFYDDPIGVDIASALTGGMINMLVLGKHCIIPKPFGPVDGGVDLFEKAMLDSLQPLGLTVSFIDCWDEYHVLLGEVHCGTNTLRTVPAARWWEFQP